MALALFVGLPRALLWSATGLCPRPVTVSAVRKLSQGLFAAHELNCNGLQQVDPVTTRSLVTRVSVTTQLAAAKLGRLVLNQFVSREHSRYKACVQNCSSVQSSLCAVNRPLSLYVVNSRSGRPWRSL